MICCDRHGDIGSGPLPPDLALPRFQMGSVYAALGAAGGFDGVDKALTLLSRDVHLAMGLLGCRSVAELKQKAPDLLVMSDRLGHRN